MIAAASSPWVAQRVPRFFFPTVAVAGGVLTALAFLGALRRLLRAGREGRRSHARALAVASIGALVLVVLPLVRFVGIMTAPAAGPPYVLVGFGEWLGGEGYPRPSAHRGIDYRGRVGSDVLAAADGRVVAARDNRDLCGLLVAILHAPHDYRTVYCHFSSIVVQPGEMVRRGQRIGMLGTTGQRAWPGYEHVHLELQRGGNVDDVENPRGRMVGCFDAQARYPVDRLVLTYPLACR